MCWKQNKKLIILGILELFFAKFKENDYLGEKQYKRSDNLDEWNQSVERKKIVYGGRERQKYKDSLERSEKLFRIKIKAWAPDIKYFSHYCWRFTRSKR